MRECVTDESFGTHALEKKLRSPESGHWVVSEKLGRSDCDVIVSTFSQKTALYAFLLGASRARVAVAKLGKHNWV